MVLFLRQPGYPEFFRTRRFVPPSFPGVTSSETDHILFIFNTIVTPQKITSDSYHQNIWLIFFERSIKKPGPNTILGISATRLSR
jgi:hypothetical protein